MILFLYNWEQQEKRQDTFCKRFATANLIKLVSEPKSVTFSMILLGIWTFLLKKGINLASSYKGLAKCTQLFNTTSCNIVAWCCQMFWMRWPNARNIFIIFKANCQCSHAPGPWRARSGPNAHALAQQCCVNVAKRVTTSCNIQNVAPKVWLFSNFIQHIATGWPNICKMLCATMLQDVAWKWCERLARPLIKLVIFLQLPAWFLFFWQSYGETSPVISAASFSSWAVKWEQELKTTLGTKWQVSDSIDLSSESNVILVGATTA